VLEVVVVVVVEDEVVVVDEVELDAPTIPPVVVPVPEPWPVVLPTEPVVVSDTSNDWSPELSSRLGPQADTPTITAKPSRRRIVASPITLALA
jgi:hypothetical protein